MKTMACRSPCSVQVLIAFILALHLLYRSVEARVSRHSLNKDWKRSFHWQEQAPTHDDGIDWASLDREAPSSSGGGSSSASSTKGFRSWLKAYDYDLGEEYKRADYLRRFPNGPSAAEYRQQRTRSIEDIRQYLKDHHPEAHQRRLADGRRRQQKYEGGFKALRAQAAAQNISDADREKLEAYQNRVRANRRRYNQKKKATRR